MLQQNLHSNGEKTKISVSYSHKKEFKKSEIDTGFSFVLFVLSKINK